MDSINEPDNNIDYYFDCYEFCLINFEFSKKNRIEIFAGTQFWFW